MIVYSLLACNHNIHIITKGISRIANKQNVVKSVMSYTVVRIYVFVKANALSIWIWIISKCLSRHETLYFWRRQRLRICPFRVRFDRAFTDVEILNKRRVIEWYGLQIHYTTNVGASQSTIIRPNVIRYRYETMKIVRQLHYIIYLN